MNPDNPTEIDYKKANRQMFNKRSSIMRELEQLGGKKRLGVRDKARMRVLQRELEDIEVDIVERNKGLVMSYANRFSRKGRVQDQEDFEAAGTAGLVAAMKSYDPKLGSFSQWAYHPIQRAITRAVRDADFANLNPGDFEKRPDILRARERLTEAGGGTSYEDIAREAGTTENQVRRVLAAPRLISVDRPLGDDEGTVGEVVADATIDLDGDVVARLQVEALENFGLGVLEDRERYVVSRHFGLDGGEPEKLAVIGERLNLSREAARQIEGKAFSKLGHPTVLRRLVRGRK